MVTTLINTRDIYKIPFGIYNACNPEPVNAKQVVDILKQYNLVNRDWRFINIDNLSTKANRSNCILSTDKIQSIGDWFKPTIDSLTDAIDHLSHDAFFSKKYIQTQTSC